MASTLMRRFKVWRLGVATPKSSRDAKGRTTPSGEGKTTSASGASNVRLSRRVSGQFLGCIACHCGVRTGRRKTNRGGRFGDFQERFASRAMPPHIALHVDDDSKPRTPAAVL